VSQRLSTDCSGTRTQSHVLSILKSNSLLDPTQICPVCFQLLLYERYRILDPERGGFMAVQVYMWRRWRMKRVWRWVWMRMVVMLMNSLRVLDDDVDGIWMRMLTPGLETDQNNVARDSIDLTSTLKTSFKLTVFWSRGRPW
jgi:hypothetical protein